MFGKAQGVVVPKGVMTPQQQAEFADFVARLRPAPARRPGPHMSFPRTGFHRWR
ncbi:hypothetical protein A8926_4942 [Saccharopolyspora spinosa]|uniref:Uncharacterized protein n=2 Tax=Saccharopolyspora spinosa TaxID=60894 RepID=A0A2N3Y264_SACSN|nr:hypothetical protein A8926_4942 [Saccharopolyspora spinosa]